MKGLTAVHRDVFAGLLVAAFGLFFAGFGLSYSIGTPSRMGPGFFPVALGALLVLLGAVLSTLALSRSGDHEPEDALPLQPDWRGWSCITGGVVAFIVLGAFAGLLPAIFGCVLLAALGDRQATLKGSLLLAAGMSIAGTFLFVYVLQASFPALRF